MWEMWEDELVPYAISIGISYDEFWNITPRIFNAYDKAYILKVKEQDKMNWYMGMYMASAIGSCMSKDAKYLDEPLLADLGLSQEEIDAKALKKMIEAEEQWIAVSKRKGLQETKV